MHGTYHYGEDDNAYSIAISCAAQAQKRAMHYYESAKRFLAKHPHREDREDAIFLKHESIRYAKDAIFWYAMARSYSGAYSVDVLSYPDRPNRS